jgi:hypothetical protein
LQFNESIINTARTLLLAIVAYFGAATGAHAATAVSGAISAHTTWTLAQSPYQVTADVSVENGATLSIEAGVVVTFDAAKNLIVTNGALAARGTAGQPIVFTSTLDAAGSTPAPGDWGQIRFLDGTNDTATIIEHAQVRYGHGIDIQSAAPTFNYLQIANNLGAAITIDLASSPKGISNQASGNTLNGVSVPAGDVLGSVTWGLKGIPYVVSSGVVSVGASPSISVVTPAEVQQSQTIDAVITGTRLTGADTIKFGAAGISAVLTAGATDTSVPVRITASATQPLGNIPFDLKTTAGWVSYGGINIIPPKPAIAVNNIAPGSIRRSEIKNFVIGGSSLLGAQVTVPSGTGLTLSNLLTTDTSASFDLAASASASLGSQTITVKNLAVANGTGAMLVNVIDLLPRLNIATIPSAVIPDGIARPFQLRLSNADTVDHSLSLSTLDPTIVSVSPASVTIPAGSTSATVNIAGLKPGYTMLNVTSPILAAVSKQVYATTLLNGAVVGPVQSVIVGMRVPYPGPAPLPVGTAVPLASAIVGLKVPRGGVSGTFVGSTVPVMSATVGLKVPQGGVSATLVGSTVPVMSATVGLNVPRGGLSTTLVGTSAGPFVSPIVGLKVP